MLKAAIFDMDGLLIDSEPLWRIAEKASFRKVGMELTDEDCKLTMGNRTNQVVEYWYDQHPWQGMTIQKLEQDIIKNVSELIMEQGEALPGVGHILDMLAGKGMQLAVASSSPMKLIEDVLSKLNITDCFSVVHSAEFEEKGKPDPAVFLNTAKQLGIAPPECLVFEDSYNGLLASQAAKMKTVMVPDEEGRADERLHTADLTIPSLLNFTEAEWVLLSP